MEELSEIKEREAQFEPSLQTMLEELKQEKADREEARRLKYVITYLSSVLQQKIYSISI